MMHFMTCSNLFYDEKSSCVMETEYQGLHITKYMHFVTHVLFFFCSESAWIIWKGQSNFPLAING